jgi:indole-3-glycerol phosphate synthase
VSAGPPTLLEGILQSTREELTRRKRALALETLAARIRSDARTSAGSERPLRHALVQPGMRVIAEFKRRSPSAGTLRERADLESVVRAYERGGASALSVLTEGPHFGGSLEDLRVAREASELPILRKDFILEAYQLYEARACGADAVLLIVAALEERELAALHERARELALEALVEVHDARELQTALDIGAELVGINNRDLRDFSVDVERTSRLVREVPDGVGVVSESGIATAEQLRALAAQGVDAVLVGEALMRAPEPEAALRELLEASSSSAGPAAASAGRRSAAGEAGARANT